MLSALIAQWGEGVHICYFDIPFEITLERHDRRPQKDVFSKEDMRRWYNLDNKLNYPNEFIFDENTTVDEAVARILAELCE
ncbi:MAG: hypothetical protein LBL96_07125 [Clostridiales bacterium]|jgi:hypothetical protein|nr:hypothetical protein [Clostridiales bacterium]